MGAEHVLAGEPPRPPGVWRGILARDGLERAAEPPLLPRVSSLFSQLKPCYDQPCWNILSLFWGHHNRGSPSWHLAGGVPVGSGTQAWGLVGQGFLPGIPSWKRNWCRGRCGPRFVTPAVDREPDGTVTASLKEGVKQCLPTTSVGWSS